MKDVQSKPSRSGFLLRGLRTIRSELVPEMARFAEKVGIHPNHYSRLERLAQGSSGGTTEAIATALHCTPADLLSEPSEQRLKEIRAAYLRAQADQAEAELAPGKAVGL